MSANNHRPHVHVLPEDDANAELARGFVQELDSAVIRQFQVLAVAAGWMEVLSKFESEHLGSMARYPERHMVLVLDFDGHEERLDFAKDRIPQHVRDRVFTLGALTEPEALKSSSLGSYETIGRQLARECRDEASVTWEPRLLKHKS